MKSINQIIVDYLFEINGQFDQDLYEILENYTMYIVIQYHIENIQSFVNYYDNDVQTINKIINP